MSFAHFLQMDDIKKQTNNIHRNNFTITPNQGHQQFQVIEENINKEQPKLERISTQISSKCVNVDSRDRNRDQYPASNTFQVQVN